MAAFCNGGYNRHCKRDMAMKISFKKIDLRIWHRYFALLPVVVDAGESSYFIWLEFVERKFVDELIYRIDYTGNGAYEGGFIYRLDNGGFEECEFRKAVGW